jgi:uncharacterized protein YbdZ (MbtH family)
MTDEEDSLYHVVVNEEEQYSIWPAFKVIPKGWQPVGVCATKESCLAHIKEIWVDMRPLSLRKKISEGAKEKTEEKIISGSKEVAHRSIVDFLTEGVHPVSLKPTNKNGFELEDSLKRQFVHFTFADTQGKTTVGIKIDPQKTVLNSVDFEHQLGTIHMEGTFILDYVLLKCGMDIDLVTLEGEGRVEILEELKPFQALSNMINT